MAKALRPRRSRPVAAAILATLLFVSGNLWLTELGRGVRVDLTENRIYSLSPETRAVIGTIVEPLRIQFYFSSALSEASPAFAAFGGRIRALLGEYASLANGLITVEEFDPAPFSEVEDRALAQGLAGLPTGADGDVVYFGLVATNSVDDQAVIPLFAPDREPELEYDLTAVVQSLADPDVPVIGVVSTLPVLGGTSGDPFAGAVTGPWHVFSLLSETYALRALDLSDGAVPADVDLLVIIHPRDLTPPWLYAIDQFLMRGGPAMIFVDPVSETELGSRPPQERFAPAYSDLAPFADG